jgi:hypothetical protein
MSSLLLKFANFRHGSTINIHYGRNHRDYMYNLEKLRAFLQLEILSAYTSAYCFPAHWLGLIWILLTGGTNNRHPSHGQLGLMVLPPAILRIFSVIAYGQ